MSETIMQRLIRQLPIHRVLCGVTLLIASAIALPANANSAPLTDDELAASVCILATSGVYLAASERQAGSDKARTEALLAQELAELQQHFSNPVFVTRIGKLWKNALESVYQAPIAKTASAKQAFVSDLTEQSLMSCLHGDSATAP